jgi:hypothetical protein
LSRKGYRKEVRLCILAEKGVNVSLSGLAIGQKIVKGGLEKREGTNASYDLQVYLDGKKTGFWKGGYGLLRAEGKTSDAGANPYAGAVIAVNFDAVVPIAEGTGFEATDTKGN